jgi:amidase
MADDLVDRSAVELSLMVAKGEVSCVDVVSAHLARIDELEPRWHALVTRRPDDAVLEDAERHDAALRAGQRVGWLHGLPYIVKDLADLQGVPTTMGLFDPDRSPAAVRDETFVARVRDAGAVFVGKSNTPELGLGSHSYNGVAPTTGNVADPARSAGGSSGGAAVAVAAGMAPVADGSDFMGSLRNPPGWNGVLGMRPSPGVVLDRDDDPQNPGFGVNGPIARTADDLRALLQTMAEPGVDVTGMRHEPRAAPRVGWLDEICDELPFEGGVLETCRTAAEAWTDSLGSPSLRSDDSLSVEELWRTWLVIRHDSVGGWVSSTFRPDQLAAMKPEVQWEVEGYRRLTEAERADAAAVLAKLRSRVTQLFDDVDLLMLPTAQVWPFPSEQTWPREIAGTAMDTYHRWMQVTTLATLAGLPVVALPAGRNSVGLHIGLQVIGRPGGDAELLDWVSWAEQRRLFTVPRPTSAAG